MRNHPAHVAGFIEAIKSWVHSIEAQKPDYAKAEAEKLHIFGRLLAEDHEFHELFSRNLDRCLNSKPEDAMHCVYAFFNAVADATRPEFRRIRAEERT
jgi:hypothetical protein